MNVLEAKIKMCPFINIAVQQPDRSIFIGNINCKCGDCMAWEWDTTLNNEDEEIISETYGNCLRLIK